MSALALADPIPPSHDNYLLCKLCEATVQVVAPLADKKLPEIEEKFIEKCKQLIGFLPLSEMECKALAAREIGPLKEQLDAGVDPAEVCKRAKAC
ncbi:unnamed protein product [Heligmosomoides polygyrus]|uniref:Saposin B-type domain-containing protein n=1 Tax=Heligmosomoides polygyrus TaxID=6339 RepID=A0A183F700_HELPZ|nr:unnamed protein product [Heligmosomoides polygyrus]